MTINSKKFFGMLFVGLAMLVANPSLGWAAEKTETDVLEDEGLEISELDYSSYLKDTVPTYTDGRGHTTYHEVDNPRFVAARQAVWNKMSQDLGRELTQAEKDKYAKSAAKAIGSTLAAEAAERRALEELVDESGKKHWLVDMFKSDEEMLQKLEKSDDPADREKAAQIRAAAAKAKADTKASKYGGADKVTYVDANGKKYTYSIKNGQASYTEGAFNGCQALPIKLYEQRKCFFCPLFAVIYRAADNMAVIGFSKLAGGFAAILALGLGLYIAFQTLTHVSSLTKQDAPKFLGTLLRQTFKFLIAFLLLQYAGQVYLYIVNPILSAGLSFGSSLLTHASPCGKGEAVKTIFYSASLYTQLECFITNVQKEIAFMQAIGTSLMCIGGNAMMFQGGAIDFGDGFWMALQGLLIGGFGFLLSLAFAFYLIDAVVQLGIVGALMPFLIASWPFKLTAQYTSKGFSMILNSFFVFVFIGLVVSVNLQLIDAAMENGAQSAEAGDKKGSLSVGGKTVKIAERNGALQGIYDAINSQNEEEIKKLTDISGTAFIILLICCIFGFKFCGQSSALADKMASGGMKGIGSSIGTMAASTAVSGAKKITKPVRDAVGDRADALVKAAPGAILGAPRALYNKFSKKKSAGGGDDEKKKSDDSPTKSTGPVTISQNKKENSDNNERTEKTESEKSKDSDATKIKDAELKNEFAQTDLGKGLDKEIVQSKAKEDAARQRELDAKGRVKSNSEKLAGVSDKNSPEAQGLSASIASDRKQEESAKKEADDEHKKGQSLQKKKAAAEKGYVSKRKNGGSVADANREAATKASKQDNYTENTRNENKPRQREKPGKKKGKKQYSRRK